MYEDHFALLLEWPRARLKRWLIALGTFAALALILYGVFWLLGW